jgi:hypothetical protein
MRKLLSGNADVVAVFAIIVAAAVMTVVVHVRNVPDRIITRVPARLERIPDRLGRIPARLKRIPARLRLADFTEPGPQHFSKPRP